MGEQEDESSGGQEINEVEVAAQTSQKVIGVSGFEAQR